jgi:hypothetical protein
LDDCLFKPGRLFVAWPARHDLLDFPVLHVLLLDVMAGGRLDRLIDAHTFGAHGRFSCPSAFAEARVVGYRGSIRVSRARNKFPRNLVCRG